MVEIGYTNRRITFGKLDIGDTFLYEGEPKKLLCMKTLSSITEIGGSTFNAISLCDGIPMFFSSNLFVNAVDVDMEVTLYGNP